MVAGGLSQNGVGKLIFVTGTMNSFSYGQTLEFYKEDLERLGKNLYFQQDNATCHVGKKSMDFIKNNFTNYLDFWPANSPDLSPIEELWSIVEERLNKYQFKNTEEMARKLQWIWNRVPKTICRNLVNSFDEKISLWEKMERGSIKEIIKVKKQIILGRIIGTQMIKSKELYTITMFWKICKGKKLRT